MEAITALLAQILAPQSLAALQDGNTGFHPSLVDQLGDNVDALQPGDLIFTRTPGLLYSSLRSLASSKYDHLALVLNKKEVLHIGPSKVRVLSIYVLVEPARKPLVLRPNLTDSQREKFLQNSRELLGQKYDVFRAYSLAIRLFLHHYMNVTLPMGVPEETPIICSDQIFNLLKTVFPDFKSKVADGTDFRILNGVSVENFLRLHRTNKALFKAIDLPIKRTPDALKKTLETEFQVQMQEFADMVLSYLPADLEYTLRDLYSQFKELSPDVQTIASALGTMFIFWMLKRILFGRRKSKL